MYFAIQCPCCDHKNKPGARYCGECGAALHLRPCPQCGRMDDVTATVCAACHAALPPLQLAKYGEGETAVEEVSSDKKKNTEGLPFGPLVLIAVIAGGLPFFWMYRANLPLPKAWRPADRQSVVDPQAIPVVSVPAAAPAAKTEPAAEDSAARATTSPEDKTSPRVASKPAHKKSADKAPAKKACTEGMAALGLCDPVKGQK
ncbi:MAG: zinc ribbon domain-containing protein [Rhodocyclaceae bacterium]|nr:MAG: zinc ribbon domain-containing protein [Rhodocyclaceae bacterium]